MGITSEAEESQGSQDLAKLLASGGPESQLEDSQQASVKHQSLDSPQFEVDPKPRRLSLLALGQGQPTSQTQHFGDDGEAEEGIDGSQKENYGSSAEASKLGPFVLCPQHERGSPRSKESSNKSHASTPIVTTFQSATYNSRPNSLGPFGGCKVGALPLEDLSSGVASEQEMQYSNWGSSSPGRLNSIKVAVGSSSPHAKSQSQDSEREYQASGGDFESQNDEDEAQAQIVSQYDLGHIDLEEPTQLEEEEPTQPEEEPTQPDSHATQSTQPANSDDPSAVSDARWNGRTGLLALVNTAADPATRERYLKAEKDGRIMKLLKEGNWEDSSSATSTPAEHRQYPAGIPEPCFSSQEEVETQLVRSGESEEPEELQFPLVQYPAGHVALEDEGMETQIIHGDSNEATSASIPSVVPPTSQEIPLADIIPPTTHAPSATPKAARDDIVPDSEVSIPPFTSQEIPLADIVPPTVRTRSAIHKATISSPAHSPQHLVSDSVRTPQKKRSVTTLPQPMDLDDEEDDFASTVLKSRSGRWKGTSVKGDSSATQMPPPFPQHPKTEEKRKATPVNAIASSSKPKQLVTEGGTSGERKGKARETRSDPRHPLRQSNRANKNQRSMAESDSGDEELNVKEEDTATELGEISEDDATSTLSSRKRKRALSVAVQRKALKRESNQTPAGAKRTSRSQSLASVKASRIFPSYRCRVLALSASDGHWFIGTVTQEHKGDTYRVEFDDGSAENARSGSMRTLELRIGDEVQDNRGTKKMGKIVEVKNDMVVVSCVKGPNFDLPFPSLRIPPDIVETQWEDRPVTRKILAGVTNSSDRWATHSTLSENADDFLKGCAVIITSNQEKDEIVASMIANGTTLIEDWSDALQIGGTYSYDKGKGKARKGKGKGKSSQVPTSWKITKKEVQWFEASEERTVERVFVIADDVCQKPKYLVALALGVPCLSTAWIKDNLNDPDGKDWSRYLLPNGSFPSVDGEDILMSQSVNLRWGTDPDHLVNIMDNPAAVKLFAGMSILCVGDGYIPEQNEDRMDAVNKFENLNTISNRSKITSGVALIILAMGACQVIACNEWQHAPQDEEFDLAVFKDPKCMAKAGKPAGKSLHVSWAWVKQSLIRGVSVKPMF